MQVSQKLFEILLLHVGPIIESKRTYNPKVSEVWFMRVTDFGSSTLKMNNVTKYHFIGIWLH